MNSNRSYETPGQYSRGYRSRGYSNRGYSNRGAYSSERKKLDYVCIEEQIADTSVEPSSINIENHFKSISNDPAREKCANCRQTGHSDLYCRVGTDPLKSFCNQETSKSKSY